MAIKVSTSSTVLDIASLFDRQGDKETITPKQALTGIFKQELINTRDYRLSLVTYVECQEEGKPQNGVEYELELSSDDKIRTFSFVDEALEYIDAYVRNKHQVQRIEFSFAGLNSDQFEIVRKSMNGRKSVKLPQVGVTIVEVDDIDAIRPVGFVKLDKVNDLAPLWDALQAKLK